MVALALTLLIQVGELDSKDPAVARKAFEAAIKAGDERALEAAGETSERARLALAEVRAHKRFGPAYPPVKLVTYTATNQPFRPFVEGMSAALGVPIEDYHAFRGLKGDEVANLTLIDAYPMEAVDGLLKEVNAQGWYTGTAFQFTRGWSRKNPHMIHWRHAAFFPHTVEDERSMDALGIPGAAFTMTVIFRHDGASRILGIRPPRSVEAIDDQGRPAKVGHTPSEPSFYWLGAQGSFKLRFEELKPECGKLARVRGILPVTIPERPLARKVPVGGRDAISLSEHHVKLTVEPIAAPAKNVRVQLEILDNKKPFMTPNPRDFEMEGKDGRRIPAKGTTVWQIMKATLDLAFDPPEGFVPESLVFTTYESTGEHEIPFEFTDVRIR